MTVREVLQHGAQFLEGKGVESPRLQVELLLEHLLGVPRLQLHLNVDRVLTEVELATLHELVQRRGGREPLQHILGTANFAGLELTVTPDVLIPRPETELLAEQAVAFLGAVREAGTGRQSARAATPESAAPDSAITLLDLGTGSGCLPIYITQRLPGCGAWTVDVSEKALAVARRNAQAHGVSDRIHFLHGDLFAALPPGLHFDLIVSNPPYIPGAEIGTLEPEVRDHDPRLALDGGTDGLEFYRRIATGAADWLQPGGKLMLELGHDQAGSVRKLCEVQMWIVEAILPDYSRVPRILIARRA